MLQISVTNSKIITYRYYRAGLDSREPPFLLAVGWATTSAMAAATRKNAMKGLQFDLKLNHVE